MDEQTLRQRIQQARDEGYSDEEIQAVLQKMGGVSMPTETPKKSEEPIVPVIPSEQLEQFNREQEAINERVNEKGMTAGTAAAMGAAAVGGPLLLYKGAQAVLRRPVNATSELANRAVQAAENIGETMKSTEGRVATNQAEARAQRLAQATQQARGPIAPTQGNVVQFPQQGQPLQQAQQATRMSPEAQRYMAQQAARGPVPGPIAPQPQSIMSQVQRFAFDKLKQYGPRAAGGLALYALTPGELGPKVPTSGPFRGMEINPQTGRPWTEQELAMLNR